MGKLFTNKKFASVVIILVFISCKQKRCDDIIHFENLEDPVAKVRSLNYQFVDSVDNPDGLKTRKAFYYSCNGMKGFFVFRNPKGSEGLRQGVPKKVWEKFKKSNSKEDFFDSCIFLKYYIKVILNENLPNNESK